MTDITGIVSNDLATVASYDLTLKNTAPLKHSMGAKELASFVSLGQQVIIKNFGAKDLFSSSVFLPDGCISSDGEAMLRMVGGLLAFIQDVNGLHVARNRDPYWYEKLMAFSSVHDRPREHLARYLSGKEYEFWWHNAIETRNLFITVELDEIRQGSVKISGLRFRIFILEISAIISGVAALPDAVDAVQKYIPVIEQTLSVGQALAQYALDEYLSDLLIQIDHHDAPSRADFTAATLPTVRRRLLPPKVAEH